VFANNIDYGALFKNQQGCFILYDLNTQKIVSQYNEPRCAEQIAPDSTFKIALSLMAFDQNLITQKTIFRWDHRHNQISAWNQNQKPATWLKYSVVWVSQRLTHQLGMEKILYYLKAFNYGNQDFSGDPGLNNALDRAWLGSSLKISANEQIQFLSKMIQNKLPVTPAAINNTEVNMFMGRLNNGWQIFGKTGTHVEQNPLNMRQITSQDGWFVGWAQRGKQIYVFVTNFTENLG
jgi:beta-lactamase class D/beta-lactamase class D OXA-1